MARKKIKDPRFPGHGLDEPSTRRDEVLDGRKRDTAEPSKVNSDADEELLTQIREDFRYCKEYWRENYDEAEKDMDCVAAIPPSDFRDDRKGRPCIWPDEVSQYTKQANNNLRQNKRGIKISAKGSEAKDTDAEHRQAYVRGIEDASKAQSIYSTGFESCVDCGFGSWRINLRVVGPKGEQEPRIVRIPNQFTVFFDPDAKESDFSDGEIAFVLDSMRHKKFAQRYPKAKKQTFTAEDMERAPDWIHGDNLVVAEAWKRGEQKDEGKDGEKLYEVTQRITNGVEILETNKWLGSWIPIIGVFGEEKYVRNGGQHKRMFFSLVRRARGNQQMLAYVASQWAEEFGMAPRAPLQGFKGQFDPKKHATLHKVPVAYAEFMIPTDWNPQWGPPPLPTRPQFEPNGQTYQMAYEQFRRAIQASMGISPLPTNAQRLNEKSGIALERIQTQEAVGSFHFTDNFVRALNNTGRQLNELITKLAETDSLPKQLLGKDQKGDDRRLHVVPREETGDYHSQFMEKAASEHLPEADLFFAHRGQFEVSVSDGANHQSEREEASEFADTLLQTLPTLGLPPQIIQQVAAIAVKLKNIGTYGDELADILAPPDPQNLSPQAKAILTQAQGTVQQLQAQVQQLLQEKEAKTIEGHFKVWAEQIKSETAKAVAEINTKAQVLSERLAAIEDLNAQLHGQAHDVALSAQEHGQAQDMAAQNAAAAQQQQQQPNQPQV